MTASVLRLPTDSFAEARAVLRSNAATRQQLHAACDALAASHNWNDIELVRQARHTLWSTPESEPRSFPPLSAAECEAIGVAIAQTRRRAARADGGAQRAAQRPTMTSRRHPDLTGFLAGCAALMLFLFLAVAGGQHVRDSAAETVAQAVARGAM